MVSRYLFGSFTRLGLVIAALTALADQALKLWLIYGFDLAHRGRFALAPYVDLVLNWNTGISYGLFRDQGTVGQWMLLIVKVVAVALLWAWLARAPSRLAAIALGLIIGGAVGNAIDRLTFGAVADFVLLHFSTATWHFEWYVFNLADVAIVAGVIGLLWDALIPRSAAKAP
ncbi:MAG: signal peptidase II [Xanthobacteraceae bacterium]|nr:signal peptidase II [Xanthobacteraceae bacterium]MBV9629798.1 signal peptidase II [Xanthobacteraceae bacterium]